MRVAERERIQPEAVLSLVNSIYLTARESCSDLASSMKIQSTKLHSSTDRELMLKLSSLKGVKLSCLPRNRSDTDLARVARSSPPHTLPPFQPPACRVQGGCSSDTQPAPHPPPPEPAHLRSLMCVQVLEWEGHRRRRRRSRLDCEPRVHRNRDIAIQHRAPHRRVIAKEFEGATRPFRRYPLPHLAPSTLETSA